MMYTLWMHVVEHSPHGPVDDVSIALMYQRMMGHTTLSTRSVVSSSGTGTGTEETKAVTKVVIRDPYISEVSFYLQAKRTTSVSFMP